MSNKIETIRSNITTYYKKQKEEYDKKREKDNRRKWSKYYQNKKWKSLRNQYFTDHPVCEVCEAEGRAVPAEHIHHKIRFSIGKDDFEKYRLLLSYDNLMSVCLFHHHLAHEIMNKENKDEVTINEIIKYENSKNFI